MNEETEPFERRLSRQPLRQIPAGWRKEILGEADKVGTARRAVRGRRSAASLPDWISNLLWPHPAAWAGLAAVWLVVLAVNVSIRDRAPALAEKFTPPPEVMVELKRQQRLLAELIGPREARDADRAKPLVPRPRTESGEFVAV
ncbi:MAG TPA: hypothetical protein VMB80_08305 [Candidatus Acidoferrum sp.]|nr:hypothetical protein [Candidatus Acidoferrum sp.]